MDSYIKKSEAVDVIVKYPYDIAGKTATAIKMIEDLPSADVVLRAELAVSSFKDAATIYNLQEINKKLLSEVDRLETEVRLLTENSISAKYPCCVSTSKGLILTKSLEEYDKLLADISSELASEIFEEFKTEMQAMVEANTLLAEYGEEKAEGRIDAYQYAIIYLNEITKKYIDGKVNSNEEKYFSPEEVRNMTPQEVREKYTAIRKSMERW